MGGEDAMTALGTLRAHNVDVWLEDALHGSFGDGELEKLVGQEGVAGLIIDPDAIGPDGSNDGYSQRRGRENPHGENGHGRDRSETQERTVAEIRRMCRILRPTYDSSAGSRGWVSLRVPIVCGPDDAAGTAAIESANVARSVADAPNLMIQLPAAPDSLTAIEGAAAQGIPMHVVGSCDIATYQKVIDAYYRGVVRVLADMCFDAAPCVASVAVAPLDAEADRQLAKIGGEKAAERRGSAGIANAKLAYRLFANECGSARWSRLKLHNVAPPRPVWSGTDAGSDDYPDTMYPTELVMPNAIVAMSVPTCRLFADHGIVYGSSVATGYDDAVRVLADLVTLGIRYRGVTGRVERALLGIHGTRSVLTEALGRVALSAA